MIIHKPNTMHQEDSNNSQRVTIYEGDGKALLPSDIIDSLPYYDVLHDDYEQYALALVEQEMQEMSSPAVSPLDPLKFKSAILRNCYRTLAERHRPLEIDLQLRAVEPFSGSDDVEAWRKAVQNARAEYEAERQRSTILEIEKSDVSTYQWRRYGTMLEQIHRERQLLMEAEKEAVDRINAERQLHQEKEGRKLHLLSIQFHNAVNKRFQLLAAIQDLERIVGTSCSDSAGEARNGKVQE